MPSSDRSGVLELYGEAVPEQFFEQVEKDLGLPARQRIFRLPLVVRLMISQRLDSKATLSTAVRQIVRQQPRALLSDHKRIREGRVSCHTGAYSDARQAMPLTVAEKVADRVLNHLLPTRRQALPGWDRPVFILDGSALEALHTEELVEAFPPQPKSHWPAPLVLVAQELTTGLAERPCRGPMHGPKAVSEQSPTEQLPGRLPNGAVVMGDIHFGVFSVAFAAVQRGHDVLPRMQSSRAEAAGRDFPLQPGLDRQICRRPSAYERRRHPELPADACVQGRLIVQRVTASDGSAVTFHLFTTLHLEVAPVLQLYGRRWNVGVSGQGHIVQSVRDRPRPKDSGLVAGEAPWRESKTAEPSDNILGKECAQRTRLQRTVNADVASLHEFPVAETVDNARKQKGLAETSPIRQLSPAGYQRRHGVKDDVETGEALGARRRKPVEEMLAITASGKCRHRHQGGGSGRSTDDGRAAKRARREGPGPVSTPSVKARQG